MKREPEMQKIVDDMTKDLYNISNTKAIEQGLCVNCKEPALAKCYSPAGKKEFYISGLCELCFDRICEE